MATENDVAALVAPEVHERYLLFTVFAFLKHENTFYCPNTACLSPIYPPEGTCGEAPRSHACPACNTRFCALCSRHEHLGTDCQGQDASLSDWASSRPVDSVKPCPGCRTLVEKNSGCNHITYAKPKRPDFSLLAVLQFFGMPIVLTCLLLLFLFLSSDVNVCFNGVGFVRINTSATISPLLQSAKSSNSPLSTIFWRRLNIVSEMKCMSEVSSSLKLFFSHFFFSSLQLWRNQDSSP